MAEAGLVVIHVCNVYARDILGRHIGIEMHPQSGEDRVKRNRYTIASMDVQTLKTGKKYREMSDVFGIYITNADFLNTHRGVNKVERTISHTGKSIPNGVSEYYVSLKCTGDTPAQTELLKYMKNSDGVMDELIKKGEPCGEMRGEKRGMKRGMKRGIKRGKLLGAIEALRELDYSQDDICNHLITKLNISEKVAKKYMEVV